MKNQKKGISIEETLQGLGGLVAFLGMAVSGIVGIAYGIENEASLQGFAILLGGSLGFGIVGGCLYGFGVLIETNKQLLETNRRILAKLPPEEARSHEFAAEARPTPMPAVPAAEPEPAPEPEPNLEPEPSPEPEPAPAPEPSVAETPVIKPVKPIPMEDGREKCPYCGAVQAAGRSLCAECGALFAGGKPPVVPIPMEGDAEKCPSCGAVQRAGRSLCWDCGVPFLRK